MLHLVPAVKSCVLAEGFLAKKAICCAQALDSRLEKALTKLPQAADGAKLQICVNGTEGEG